MKKKGRSYDLLKYLYQCDQIRTCDFNLLASAVFKTKKGKSNKTKAIKASHDMEADGFIETVEYYSPEGKKNEKITRITPKGRNFIVDTESDPYYREKRERFERTFGTHPIESGEEENKKVKNLLQKTGVLSMFQACGVPTLAHDKPSLRHLIDIMSGSDNPETVPEYYDTTTKEDCEEYLDYGIYYTIKEVARCADSISQDVSDTIMGSVAMGVFISTKSCYVVYAAERYQNHIIRLYGKGENGLLNFLMTYIPKITDVHRVIPELQGYDHNFNLTGDRFAEFRNEIYAIVLSDGEMLTYATSMGFSKGRTTKRGLEFKKRMRASEKADKKKNEQSYSFLTSDNNLYPKIYVVETATVNGLASLKYLTSISVEEQLGDGRKIMGENKKIFVENPDADNMYHYLDKSTGLYRNVMYMPVFEAKELAALARSDQKPVIITFRDLLNPIAHSIGKDCDYYNIEEGKFFDKDTAFIYNECGEISGERILDDFLKEVCLTFDKKIEGYDLPKRLGMERTVFYNAIARGELDINDIIDQITTKEIRKDNRSYSQKVRVTLYFSPDEKDEIVNLAKSKDLSIVRYMAKEHQTYMKCKEIVKPYLPVPAEEGKGSPRPSAPDYAAIGKAVIDEFSKLR